MPYLHGVETVIVKTPGQTTNVVKSAILAIIGIAPIGDLNKLTLCMNDQDDAQFGNPLPGFDIPKTLAIVREIAGNTPVVVVNVFDPTSHTSQVTDEAKTIASGKLKLGFAPIGAVTVKDNAGAASTLVLGTDYSIDAYGNFQVLSSAAAAADATTLKFSYKKLNAAAITGSVIVGAIDGTTELRTGMKLLDECYSTFGFNPKIIVSPGYTSLSSVAAALESAATKFKGIYYIDAPFGITPSAAIAGRGVGGTINFNTASRRAELLYPYAKSYDVATEGDLAYPLSAFKAALRIKVDIEEGYWVSDSNHAIGAITGIERVIEFNPNDSGCVANQLNGAGISTLVQNYGTGFKSWGNRSAAFPTDSDKRNFICVQRVNDMVIESMAISAANEDLDKPITQAFIDYLLFKGNSFISKLIQDGALYPGSKLSYVTADNTPEELAAGHIVFERGWDSPAPAERITFKDILDINIGAKALA